MKGKTAGNKRLVRWRLQWFPDNHRDEHANSHQSRKLSGWCYDSSLAGLLNSPLRRAPKRYQNEYDNPTAHT